MVMTVRSCDYDVTSVSAYAVSNLFFSFEDYDPLPGPPSYSYDPGQQYTMEKPPTLDVTSSEFSPPLKGPAAATFLDDGIEATRFLPDYPSLQTEPRPVVSQPENGEQLAYSNPPIPEYYNEPQMARGLPLSQDTARPTALMQGQIMSAPGPSPGLFSGTVSLHRPSSGADSGVSRYSVAPAYGGRGQVVVGDGSDHALMYHDSNYGAMLPSPMNRPAARRGPFKNNDDREKTAQTRKIGSCVRCRMQRIRVSPQLQLLAPLYPNSPVRNERVDDLTGDDYAVPDKPDGARRALPDVPKSSFEHEDSTTAVPEVQDH